MLKENKGAYLPLKLGRLTTNTSLYEEFGMPQSTISQHLSKLKTVNVVSGTRKGLEIYYEVKDKRVEIILDAIVSA